MIAKTVMSDTFPRLGPVRNAALTACYFAIGCYGRDEDSHSRLQAHIRRMVPKAELHYHRDDNDGYCSGG